MMDNAKRTARETAWRTTVTLVIPRLGIVAAFGIIVVVSSAARADDSWVRKSSTTGDLAIPNDGQQQTCCTVGDFDKDGIVDFVVGERTRTPSVVWYRYKKSRWERLVIDATHLKPEAGGEVADLDGDGDLDLVLGQDASGNAMWWWENPYPDFSRPWKRRYIKQSGANKHHDQTIADYDGDGRPELVSWNQKGHRLLLFEIPPHPRTSGPWPATTIFRWSAGQEMEGFPSRPVDIDLDGTLDIVGGGRWFKYRAVPGFKHT